jgi:hypothetical protein
LVILRQVDQRQNVVIVEHPQSGVLPFGYRRLLELIESDSGRIVSRIVGRECDHTRSRQRSDLEPAIGIGLIVVVIVMGLNKIGGGLGCRGVAEGAVPHAAEHWFAGPAVDCLPADDDSAAEHYVVG